jgi:hypothetical protein
LPLFLLFASPFISPLLSHFLLPFSSNQLPFFSNPNHRLIVATNSFALLSSDWISEALSQLPLRVYLYITTIEARQNPHIFDRPIKMIGYF